jgi:hypothetical protein
MLYDAQLKAKDAELADRAASKRREARSERNARHIESYARRGVDVSIFTSSF